jgi:DNA (cytosine-5)-methyltransferase 1
MREGDIHALAPGDLPGAADLAWASFPCQDLSLAGNGAGLKGARSSAFFGFRDLIAGLAAEGRAPGLLVVENVVGALTSNNGADFETLAREIARLGYVFGALTLDAEKFLPQSRPRLFVVAARADRALPPGLVSDGPDPLFASAAVTRAQAALPADLKKLWRWWRLPAPPLRNSAFGDLIEAEPRGVVWHSTAETQRLLAMMSPVNAAKLAAAKAEAKRSGVAQAGALYRRTRTGPDGGKVQRAEARFDGVAGCLRTPGGGSSRQFVILVEPGRVRTRLLSAREAARLMGLPDDFRLPASYNEAYHLLGDGLATPCVAWLARHLLEPLAAQTTQPKLTAAPSKTTAKRAGRK